VLLKGQTPRSPSTGKEKQRMSVRIAWIKSYVYSNLWKGLLVGRLASLGILNGDWFKFALKLVFSLEGKHSNNHLDPGGETYMGISRVYWPDWHGWEFIDKGKDVPIVLVEKFYRQFFWDRISGDAIAKKAGLLAVELFEAAVNVSPSRASKFLQESLNLLNRNQAEYADILVDGKIGPMTIGALEDSLITNPEPRIIKVANILQGEHYINIMRKTPIREEFRGWFDRT